MDTPARSRPQTSRDAIDQITRSGKRKRHVELIAQFVVLRPGHTSNELAAIGKRPHLRPEISRRLPEAERLGLIHRGEVRKCTVSGMKCLTWWPKG
jgi:hypothetical protein